MSDGYFTVEKETENVLVIERSKFICSIKPVLDEVDAKNFIENIRKKHSLATHNCYAYIADDKGLIQKFLRPLRLLLAILVELNLERVVLLKRMAILLLNA